MPLGSMVAMRQGTAAAAGHRPPDRRHLHPWGCDFQTHGKFSVQAFAAGHPIMNC